MAEKKGIKVVHVHFPTNPIGKKNFYFSSVSAVFKKFTKDDIGASENYVRHQLTEDNHTYMNKRVMIVRSRILT